MLRDPNLSLEVRCLIDYMESLSKDYTEYTWCDDLEYELWTIVSTGQPTKRFPLPPHEIDDLQQLYRRAGVWIRRPSTEELLPRYGLSPRWQDLQPGQFNPLPYERFEVYTESEWEIHLFEHAL